MLDKLINEGNELKEHLIITSEIPPYVDGEIFEKWRTKCIAFLSNINKTITDNFNNVTKNSYEANLRQALGILMGLKEYQETK